MSTKQNNATVVGFEKGADCLFFIRIRPDWDFYSAVWHPGQFLRIGILDEQFNEKSLRAMTILSIKEEALEFLMVAVNGGLTSPRMANLSVGDRCYLEPMITGNFHTKNLPDLNGKDLWMMGTGTGIAPYISMLRNSQRTLERCRRILLVHSIQKERHQYSNDEIASLTQSYPSLMYVPVITKSNKTVDLGLRIQDLLLNKRLVEVTGVPIATDSSFVMLCGHPEMIKQSVHFLKELGLVKHRRRTPGHILTERYF